VSFCPLSALYEKNNPRNINYMTAVISIVTKLSWMTYYQGLKGYLVPYLLINHKPSSGL